MKNLFFFALTLALAASAQAQSQKFFVYEGVAKQSNGLPLEDSAVSFRVQIVSPDEQCLLFEETHTLDMTGSQGRFVLRVGQGTATANDPAIPFSRLFANNIVVRQSGAGCPSGYASGANDTRSLKISINGTLLSPSVRLGNVPSAAVAETLQGKGASDFVTTANGVSQTRVEQVIGDNATFAKLQGLLSVNFGTGQSVRWNGSSFEGYTPAGGGMTGFVAGTGLLGGTIGNGDTLAVNVGIGSGQIVQVQGGGQLPALSGSNLTNLNASNVSSGTLSIANGGTGASSASAARINIGAAGAGANTDITELSALTVPLSVSQGGTGRNSGFGANMVLVSDGSGNMTDTTGSNGQFLTANTITGPQWVNSPVPSGATNGQVLSHNGMNPVWINPPPQLGPARDRLYNFEEFMQFGAPIVNAYDSVGAWSIYAQPTTASVAQASPSVDLATHPGLIILTPPSSGAGDAGLMSCQMSSATTMSPSMVLAGSGTIETLVKLPASIPATTTIRFGFVNTLNTTAPSKGVWFEGTGTGSSVTWNAKQNNGGLMTQAAGSSTVSTWVSLRIEYDSTIPTTRFYVNNALATTITSSFPSGSTDYVCPQLQIATTSTATTSLTVDYIGYSAGLPSR